jgi:hypothetical protein
MLIPYFIFHNNSNRVKSLNKNTQKIIIITRKISPTKPSDITSPCGFAHKHHNIYVALFISMNLKNGSFYILRKNNICLKSILYFR